MAASQLATKGQPAPGGKSWPSKVFAFNPAGLHWDRGVWILDVMLVPLIVFWAIGHEQYVESAVFGVLFTAVADPGGSYGSRVSRVAGFGLVGAALTALGFGIGGDAWGWLVLAAFAVTLLAGLAIAFGVHRFVAFNFLNIWFIISLSLASSYHHTHQFSYTWAQVLAWAGGSALWIAVTFIAWLIRGRKDVPQWVAELPGDTSRHPLAGPVIMFAVIRAVVVAGTTALAYGLNLTDGHWITVAAIIAMKPDLVQTTLVAVQRLVGVVMGAAAACLLLLIPANEHGKQLVSITHGLEVVALVLIMHAVAVIFWNYTFFAAAVSAAVLILMDVQQPTDYATEGYRVLWTLCGVAIAFVVMLLAGLLAKRAPAPKQPAPAGQAG